MAGVELSLFTTEVSLTEILISLVYQGADILHCPQLQVTGVKVGVADVSLATWLTRGVGWTT